MDGIFTFIGVVSGVNVGICTIHGVFGIRIYLIEPPIPRH